ncbi:MAG: YraN family protein [Deltaproteobacteria bacterium]|nr:YraN family protein [Deltaproteobacteria bacterium]HCH62670.1 YraN family protein [Deltaproteobacteria bacterium]
MSPKSSTRWGSEAGADPARLDARQRGIEAEALVAEQLGAKGWTVLARNWRGGGGELDLVVRSGVVVRFVEVKQRVHADADPVSPAQVRRLRSAARAWMVAQPVEDWEETSFWLVEVDAHDVLQWWLDPF